MSLVTGFVTAMVLLILLLAIYGPALVVGFFVVSFIEKAGLFYSALPWMLLSDLWAGIGGAFLFSDHEVTKLDLIAMINLHLMVGMILIGLVVFVRQAFSTGFLKEMELTYTKKADGVSPPASCFFNCFYSAASFFSSASFSFFSAFSSFASLISSAAAGGSGRFGYGIALNRLNIDSPAGELCGQADILSAAAYRETLLVLGDFNGRFVLGRRDQPISRGRGRALPR